MRPWNEKEEGHTGVSDKEERLPKAEQNEFYLNPDHAKYDPEAVRRAIHDLITFKIPSGLTAPEFDRRLGDAFRKTPFVRDFADLLKEQASLRFGAVNNWIH